MTADLRPYPEYKDSGLPWLGTVPIHWDVRRNGRLFAQRNETGFGDLPILEVSLKTGVRVRDMENLKRKQIMADRDKYKRAAKEDIAYNMMRMWQGAVGVAPVDGLVSPAYVVASPYPGTDTRYFSYLFRTQAYMAEVDGYSRGIVKDRNRLYWQDFKRMPSCYPPPEEQTAIANYLDANAVLVRKFIHNRQRLIEVVNQRNQLIINEVVTRGSEVGVKLKPSGAECLGEVPESWHVIRFKYRIGLQEGPGIMAADFRDSGVPLLRISCLADLDASLDGCNYLDPIMVEKRWDHFRVKLGEYLLSASANTSGISRVTEGVVGAVPYTGIIRLWPLSQVVHMEYLRYFMKSQPFREQVDLAKSGVGIEHFGPTHLKDMWICLPPPSQQLAIVKRLDAECLTAKTVVGRANREIDLMREYRTRLVADVVMGKLDVRQLALSSGIQALVELEPIQCDASLTDALLPDDDTDDAEGMSDFD